MYLHAAPDPPPAPSDGLIFCPVTLLDCTPEEADACACSHWFSKEAWIGHVSAAMHQPQAALTLTVSTTPCVLCPRLALSHCAICSACKTAALKSCDRGCSSSTCLSSCFLCINNSKFAAISRKTGLSHGVPLRVASRKYLLWMLRARILVVTQLLAAGIAFRTPKAGRKMFNVSTVIGSASLVRRVRIDLHPARRRTSGWFARRMRVRMLSGSLQIPNHARNAARA
jgi:hypothetical protein